MIISLIIIFVFGAIVPNIINGFAPDSEPENMTTFIIGLSGYISKGVCMTGSTSWKELNNISVVDAYGNPLDQPKPIEVKTNDGFCINPNSLILSEEGKETIVNSIEAFGYLPPVLSTPILIMILLGIGITTVTLGIALLTLIPFVG